MRAMIETMRQQSGVSISQLTEPGNLRVLLTSHVPRVVSLVRRNNASGDIAPPPGRIVRCLLGKAPMLEIVALQSAKSPYTRASPL